MKDLEQIKAEIRKVFCRVAGEYHRQHAARFALGIEKAKDVEDIKHVVHSIKNQAEYAKKQLHGLTPDEVNAAIAKYQAIGCETTVGGLKGLIDSYEGESNYYSALAEGIEQVLQHNDSTHA